MDEQTESALEIYLLIPDDINLFLDKKTATELKNTVSSYGLEGKISGVVITKQIGDKSGIKYAVFHADPPNYEEQGNPFSNINNLIKTVEGYVQKNPKAILLITDIPTSSTIKDKFKEPHYKISLIKY